MRVFLMLWWSVLVPVSSAGLHGLQHHFSCPFADVWVEHGPEKAAKILGVEAHRDVSSNDKCSMTIGFAGGGHQSSASSGYSNNCSGTPGQLSPYMWPMAFTYQGVETTMPFDTNTPTLVKNTRKWYRFDKAMKRSDSVGQTPSAPDDLTTVLHRNSMMYILYWHNDTDFKNASHIKYCLGIDMGVIGLLRPDFFMDSRPYSAKDIQSQYLGDQHVYYQPEGPNKPGAPRLVKQWRKTDFINTTFVMSMAAHNNSEDSEEGIHWPLLLDIPGEGSGPDVLQMMYNHALITDDDDAVFFLDQEFMANGGECHNPFNQTSFTCEVCLHTYDALHDGDGLDFEDLPDDWLCPVCGAVKSAYKSNGKSLDISDAPAPPAPVPSALEQDVHAWREIEYTFSPVWKPPTPAPPTPSPPTPAPADEYICSVCKHVYNAHQDGDDRSFEELPDDWVCPVCAAPKTAYNVEGNIV